MKTNKLIYTSLLLMIAGLYSCTKVLDTEPMASYDEITVWSSKEVAESFVYGTLSNIMHGYVAGNQTAWEERTNNIVHVANGNDVVKELLTRESTIGGLGNFGNIRRTNLIIEKATEYNGDGLTDLESRVLVAKGKLLRALLYYQQARTMGRFVWVDRVLIPADTANAGLALPTTSNTTESYTYILKDLEEAIPDLPLTAAPGDITRNLGYAFQSEIALQAAAYEPDHTLQELWLNTAIEAAQNVTASGLVGLTDNFGAMFNEQDPNANEIIFALYRHQANTLAQAIPTLQNLMPNTNNNQLTNRGYGPLFQTNGGQPFIGWLWWSPTQNLVDAFDMIDQETGEAVSWSQSSQFLNSVSVSSTVPDWTLPEEEENVIWSAKLGASATKSISELMYEHRDQRFYDTFVWDGATWYTEDIKLAVEGNLWRRVHSNMGPHIGITNYYFRKGIYNVQPRVMSAASTNYHYVVMRYGRVLLNQAEAILWLAKLGKASVADAVALCNLTRTIHGKLPASNANTLEEAWELYKKERRAELALENDYYWSLLRWGKHGGYANDGVAPSGKMMEFTVAPTYVEIASDRSEMYIGEVRFNQHHVRNFDENRRYLFPIPQGQINRNSNLGPQNPGW